MKHTRSAKLEISTSYSHTGFTRDVTDNLALHHVVTRRDIRHASALVKRGTYAIILLDVLQRRAHCALQSLLAVRSSHTLPGITLSIPEGLGVLLGSPEMS